MSELEEPQTALFDLSGREFNVNWVDDKQPLFIPNNPIHWKAHKLQILVARLEKQASQNPAQFNSKNYIDALNELEKLMNEINKGITANEEILGSSNLGSIGNSTTEETHGEIEPISMDS